MAALLALVALGTGPGAVRSFARGYWQVLQPLGPTSARMVEALLARGAEGFIPCAAALAPKVLAAGFLASAATALASSLPGERAPRQAMALVASANAALAALWLLRIAVG